MSPATDYHDVLVEASRTYFTRELAERLRRLRDEFGWVEGYEMLPTGSIAAIENCIEVLKEGRYER